MGAKEIVLAYCDDIVSGRIASGRYLKKSVERFLNDVYDNANYYVDWKEVENVYNLGLLLKQYEGKWAGMPLRLEPWQLFIATNIFAVKDKTTNIRKYRTSYTKCAKKQGKSLMTVLFLLYGALSEPNAGQSFFCANAREQAKIGYRMLEHLCTQLDPKHKSIKILRNEMRIKENDGFIKVMSSDSSKADGINVSFAIVDEFEEAVSNALFENLLSATAARDNSHIAVISTAGFDLLSADYEMLTQYKKILDGEVIDDTAFAAIYMMDDDDDWEDENNWIKCNPNLGVSVSMDFLRKRAQTAKTSNAQYSGILTKNFNVYLSSSDVWIPNVLLHERSFIFDYDYYKQHRGEYIVFGGFDLSSVSDFTALSLMFYHERTGKMYFYTKYYLPETALSESPNRDKYKEWRRRGFLTITPGNCVDYDAVLNDIVKFHSDFNVIWFGYDPYNATYLVIKATEAGCPLEEFGQNILNFNQPTKEIERLLREGIAYIDDNPINYFCFNNVYLKEDQNQNVKPVKKASEKTFKIDGVISMLTCLGEYFKYYSW